VDCTAEKLDQEQERKQRKQSDARPLDDGLCRGTPPRRLCKSGKTVADVSFLYAGGSPKVEDKAVPRRPSAKSLETKSFADSAPKKGADAKDPSAGGAKKKQSEMTKAERSALQEAQRAAKAAKKTGGDNAAGAGGSEASSASSVPASKGPKPSSLPPPRNPSVSSLVPSSKPSESSHATESRTKLKNSVAMCEVRTTQK